jgi:hypothetical protein
MIVLEVGERKSWWKGVGNCWMEGVADILLHLGLGWLVFAIDQLMW